MHSVKKERLSAEQRLRKKAAEKSRIEAYRALCDSVNQSRANGAHDASALTLTTQLLDWNPELYTTWNYRREILSELLAKDNAGNVENDGNDENDENDENASKLLTSELSFSMACLRKFPKVYWIWNHRRWCLEHMPQTPWTHELGLVAKMLELDARNFHGWQYRRYVIGQLETANKTSHVDQELAFTKTKINANFSNFSAWHNRTKLVPLYLEEHGLDGAARLEFVHQELDYIRQALYTDPDDQSSWLYHEWVVTSGAIVPKDSKLLEIVQQELKSVQELAELEPDCKWCLIALVRYHQFAEKLGGPSVPKTELHGFLERLQVVDPMRKGHYRAMLSMS